MVKITFIEINNNYEIKVIDENSFITDILRKYANTKNKNINQLYFSYNGKFLSFNAKRNIKNLGNREITIFVYCTKKREPNEKLKNTIINKNNLFNLSNTKFDIITCEQCYSIPKLTLINQNKVKIYCKTCGINIIKDISYFKKFIKKSKEEKIDLPNCTYNKNHKSKSTKYCLQCNKYLCGDCIKNHKISFEGKNHLMIQQEIQNRYYCQKEGHQEYILERYCKKCEEYLCSKCKCSHENSLYYSIYSFDNPINKSKINEVIENLNKFEEVIKSEELNLNNYIEELENKIKSLKEIFNKYKERNKAIFLFFKLLIHNYKKMNIIRNYNLENNIFENGNFDLTNSDNFIKENDNFFSNECFHSKYNKLYSFYMNKNHIKTLNYCEYFVTQKFCNNDKIKKIIFIDDQKIIFIFYNNQNLYYLYEKKDNEYEIIKKLNSNSSFVRDIYPLKNDKFLSTHEKNEIILWKINEDNIASIGLIKGVYFITFDLFNKDNCFLIEKKNDNFRIKYYNLNKHLVSTLLIKNNIYSKEYIFKDINYIIDNYKYHIMEESKNMLNNLIKNLQSRNEEKNKNLIFELNNKLLEEIDKTSLILYKDLIENNLKETNKFIINTNYIIFTLSNIMNNQFMEFKEYLPKINFQINFYNLIYEIRKSYIYYLLVSCQINNVYNLNNEYLLFMGQNYLFIKYSLLEREFSPVVTNNFIPESEIDYNNYEIKSILQDYIILNDFNNKYIYIIESNRFLMLKEYYNYYDFVTTNGNYLLFNQIINNKIQFTFINLTKSPIDENNEGNKELVELLNFNIDINSPKILLSNNNIFIHLFEQNQLCLVKYKLNIINNIESISTNYINEIKLIHKNEKIIVPEISTSSSLYNIKYDAINLFTDNLYYCSYYGKVQNLKFTFDDEYYFTNIKFEFHEDFLNCRPKKFSIEISDKKRRCIKTIKIEDEDHNNNLSETVNLNESGKYIELNISDNYGGQFIIIKRIYFSTCIINIIKNQKKKFEENKK